MSQTAELQNAMLMFEMIVEQMLVAKDCPTVGHNADGEEGSESWLSRWHLLARWITASAAAAQGSI